MADEDFNDDIDSDDPLALRRGDRRLPDRPVRRSEPAFNPLGLSVSAEPGPAIRIPSSFADPDIAQSYTKVNTAQVQSALARDRFAAERAAEREKLISKDVEAISPEIQEDTEYTEAVGGDVELINKQSLQNREARGEAVDYDAPTYNTEGALRFASPGEMTASSGFSGSAALDQPQAVSLGETGPTSNTPVGRAFAQRRREAGPAPIRLTFAPGLERIGEDDRMDLAPEDRPVPLTQGDTFRRSQSEAKKSKATKATQAKRLEKYNAAVAAGEVVRGEDYSDESRANDLVRDAMFPTRRDPALSRSDAPIEYPTTLSPAPPPVGTVIPGAKENPRYKVNPETGELGYYLLSDDASSVVFYPRTYKNDTPYKVKQIDHDLYERSWARVRAETEAQGELNARMRERAYRSGFEGSKYGTRQESGDFFQSVEPTYNPYGLSAPTIKGLSSRVTPSGYSDPDETEVLNAIAEKRDASKAAELQLRQSQRASGSTAPGGDVDTPYARPATTTGEAPSLEELNRGGFAKRFSDILENRPEIERRYKPIVGPDGATRPRADVLLGVGRDYLGPRSPSTGPGVTHDTQFSTISEGLRPLVTGEVGFVTTDPDDPYTGVPEGVDPKEFEGVAQIGRADRTAGQKVNVQKFDQYGVPVIEEAEVQGKKVKRPATTQTTRPERGEEYTPEGAQKAAAGLIVPPGFQSELLEGRAARVRDLRRGEIAARDIAARTSDPSWSRELRQQASELQRRRNQIPGTVRLGQLAEEAVSQQDELQRLMEDYPGRMGKGGDNPLGGSARRVTLSRSGGIAMPGTRALGKVIDPATGRLVGGALSDISVPQRSAVGTNWVEAARQAGLAGGRELTPQEAERLVREASAAAASGLASAAGAPSASALEATRAINTRNISETGEIVDKRNPPIRETAMGEDPEEATPARRMTFRRGNRNG